MEQVEKLLDLFPLKVTSTMILLFFMDVRTVLFLAFAILVILDCFTRWTAISFRNIERISFEKPTLLQSLLGIPQARRDGKIRSGAMRQGMDKILIYLLCTMAASSCDLIFELLHTPAWMTSFVVGYMSVTEILSIIENLSDAGCSSLTRLAEKIKEKIY
ncbi:phage holin family protein [uncultured Dialister sp.]|jgi:phage-related holin|uniref:phage holin family protein n=1 Tax=uncultured Dialister sp. TaxID=278064 RepID=UPI0025F3C8F0|nr:phage holin family protein [uncultured Dialister sp.]